MPNAIDEMLNERRHQQHARWLPAARRGEIIRGKFRNSPEKPEPFEPGRPTKIEYTVSDTFHTFRRGHRIMIQIQSTWFPLFDINPGRLLNIYQATEADFQKTTQRVYRSRALASLVRVGVLTR